MRFVINIILFLNLFHNLFSVIPNWNLTAIGENLLTSDKYTWTVSMDYYEYKVYLEITFTKENGTINKKNKIKINNDYRDVNFDDIQSFYHLNGKYYICPKGNHHVYDFWENKYIIPDGFVEKKGTKFHLKCFYHKDSSTFIVFYLMNGEYSMYAVYIGEGENIAKMKKIKYISDEVYDFKMENGPKLGNNGYIMLSLNNIDSYLKINRVETTLERRADGQYVNQVGAEVSGIIREYVQSYFKVSKTDNYIDFFYISYNNIDDFYSGYTTYGPSYKDVTQVKVSTNQASFEFLEDVEIEEMNFLPYNRYVYYKMKNKNTSLTIYYGIYDTKLNNVIFNTDEYLKYYIPISDREMLAVTNTSIYKICAIRDQNNNECVDYCSNEYLLSTQGNKCNDTNECKPGEYLLAPSFVCNQTCDESIFHFNGTYCGLCSYFNHGGNQYKLLGAKGCRGNIEDNMEYYNERLKILKCKEGYILSGTDCKKNITCFNTCQTCEEESDNIQYQKCLTCKEPYLFENGNCVIECSQGYEKSGNGCQSCKTDKCITFEQNTCNCLNCSYHFYVNDSKKCDMCDQTCSTCNETSTKCTSCLNDFFLFNSTCYKCESENCLNFSDGNKKCKCEKCKDGFYYLNYQCKNCVENCKTCSNSLECEICQENFFLNSKGYCSACPTKCATKKSDNCQCETCIEHYFMNSNEECQECNTECKNCEKNADSCTECANNYFFNEQKKCEECDQKCKTCSKEKTNCTSCVDGLYMTNENKCEVCNSKCQTCSGGGESDCLSCNENSEYKYLIFDEYNKTCVKNCTESGREFSGNAFKCKPLIKSIGSNPNTLAQKGKADLLLWIFVGIFGVILIITTVCIIKKCCNNKNNGIEEEINQELNGKEEIFY